MTDQQELDDKALKYALKQANGGIALLDKHRENAINRLLSEKRLLISISEQGQPVYRYQGEDTARRMREMGAEEFLIYEQIAEAKDRGITANDLRHKLQVHGMTTVSINKVLKKFEKSGTVKKLKSLQQKGKQVFMLTDVEPSSEVTAGLVNHEDFNLEVIEVVQERVLQYLKSHGATSYREIALHIKQSGAL
jgi:DNA-binding MarR family transcriptional regulator